jgi:hypothetical protein
MMTFCRNGSIALIKGDENIILLIRQYSFIHVAYNLIYYAEKFAEIFTFSMILLLKSFSMAVKS